MSEWPNDTPEMVRDIATFLDDTIEQFIAHLGESPEAWRGAISLTEFIRGMTKEVLEALSDEVAITNPRESTLLLTMIMTALVSFYEHHLTVEMRRHLRSERRHE